MGDLWNAIVKLWNESGFAQLFNFQNGGWKNLIMIGIACILIYLAVKKASSLCCCCRSPLVCC